MFRIATLATLLVTAFSLANSNAIASTVTKNHRDSCTLMSKGFTETWKSYGALSRESFRKQSDGTYKIEYFAMSGDNSNLRKEMKFLKSHVDKGKTLARVLIKALTASVIGSNYRGASILLAKSDGLLKNAENPDVPPPLVEAAMCSDFKMLSLFLKNDPNRYVQATNNMDALWVSIVNKDPKLTTYLLDHNFDACKNYRINNAAGDTISRYDIAIKLDYPYPILKRLHCDEGGIRRAN